MNDFFIKKLKKKRIRSSRTQNFFFQKIKNQNNFFLYKKKTKQLKKERVLYKHERKELKKKNEKTRVKDLTHKSSMQVPITHQGGVNM